MRASLLWAALPTAAAEGCTVGPLAGCADSPDDVRGTAAAPLPEGEGCEVACPSGDHAWPPRVQCVGGGVSPVVCSDEGVVDQDAIGGLAARLETGPVLEDQRGMAGRFRVCEGIQPPLLGIPRSFDVNVTIAASPNFYTSGTGGQLVAVRKGQRSVAATSIEHRSAGRVTALVGLPGRGEYELELRDPEPYPIKHSFRSTRIRVGDPWDCKKARAEAVVVAPHGPPGRNIDEYLRLTRDLLEYDASVTVVLPMAQVNWTRGSVDGPCDLEGKACEDPLHCDPGYCEVERWELILEGLRAAGSHVRVAALVDVGPAPEGGLFSTEVLVTQLQSVRALGVDAFYLVGHDGGGRLGVESLKALLRLRLHHAKQSWFAIELQEPLFHPPLLEFAGLPDLFVTTRSGPGTWSPYAWYGNTQRPPSFWGTVVAMNGEWWHDLEAALDAGYGTFVLRHAATEAEDDGSVAVLLRAITWKAKGPPPGHTSAGNATVQVTAPVALSWECDESAPRRCDLRCFARRVVAPAVTARERCGGAPPPGCCPCYHSVAWQCTGEGGLVCLAAHGAGKRQRVGDLVCDGIWKPDCEEVSRRTATSTGAAACVKAAPAAHPYPAARFTSPALGKGGDLTVEEQLSSAAVLAALLAALLPQ